MSEMEKSMQLAAELLQGDYEDKIVGFIDILGFSHRVKTSRNPSDFSTILPIAALQKMGADTIGKPQVFLFTDCMYLIADQKDLEDVLHFIATYQVQLMNSAIPGRAKGERIQEDYLPMLRGGIAFGKMFLASTDSKDAQTQNVSFFGKAMLDAYACDGFCEEPVILVTPEMVQHMKPSSEFIRSFTVHRKDAEISVSAFDWKRYLEARGELLDDLVHDVGRIIDNAIQSTDSEKVKRKYCFMRKYLENRN